MKSRRIFAIGGMVDLPTGDSLFEAFLRLTGKPFPVVAYLGTASGDRVGGVEMFVWRCVRLGAVPRVIPLFQRTPDLGRALDEVDAVFVGGGNTFSMLAVWRAWGLDRILRKRYEQGVILGGVSAGAICWFAQALTDSWADELRVMEGLGWLEGCGIPHYRLEAERKPATERFLREGVMSGGLAIDDGAGVLFENEVPRGVISATPEASAYRVRFREGCVVEEPLPVLERITPGERP